MESGNGRADGRSFSSSDAFGAKGAVADRLDVTPQPSFNVRPLTARWRIGIHDPARASCVLQPAFGRRLADGRVNPPRRRRLRPRMPSELT